MVLWLALCIVISIVIRSLQKVVFACDQDLGKYLIFNCIYFSFLSARNFGVAVLLCRSNKPQVIRDWSSVIFLLTDAVLVSLMTLYGLKNLFEPEGLICRDNGEPETFQWWVISCVCLVIGLIYSALLCVGFASVPLIVIFWCYFKLQMEELENENNTGLEQPVRLA